MWLFARPGRDPGDPRSARSSGAGTPGSRDIADGELGEAIVAGEPADVPRAARAAGAELRLDLPVLDLLAGSTLTRRVTILDAFAPLG